MARTVRDANLETRAARQRLKQTDTRSREPYWRTIDPGAHLGYYKGARGGSWLARLYQGGRYLKTSLGTADDETDADGLAVLSFRQAQEKARAWFAEQARIAAGLEPVAAGPYTVGDAIDDYLVVYRAGGTKGKGRALKATEAVIDAHIRPALGALNVAALTTNRLRGWHHGLAAEPARARTAKGSDQRHRRLDGSDGDEDAKRRRQATANRVLTILKAVLNHAKRDKKAPSDDAWRDVKPYHDVDAPVVRYLSEAECTRLVNATVVDFRPMVRAALLTGCRYGELVAVRVSAFNPDAGTLAIRASKSGKPRHVVLTDEGRRFFEAATIGRSSGALIFTRLDGEPWGKNHQQRRLAGACKAAKISPAVSFHILRHTHGTILATKGVPMAVIGAQLGHAPGSPMTARHYAHVAPSYVADTIRAKFPDMGIVPPSGVRTLRPKRREQ
jgi:integrase